MAKKVKIDVDELNIAIKEFNKIDSINLDSSIGRAINVSDNWDGDAAKEFISKMHLADLDRVAIDRTAKELASYCRKMKTEGEWMDNWLYKFVDWITFWD